MKLKNLGITLGVAFFLATLSASPVMADSATVSSISKELICQCGCGRILNSHVCDTQEAMGTLIEQKLAQGQSEEQIIQYFVAQYGEQVLASPPKRGFNLTAWLSPIAALLLGSGVIYVALKQWLRRGKSSQTIPMAQETNEEYRHRLEKDLEEFTERGFR